MLNQIQNELDKVIDKLQGWLESFILMLPNLALAIIVIIAFYFISKGIRNLLQNFLTRFSKNYTINAFLSQVTFVLIIIIGLFFALGILNLQKTVTSLLAGVGIVGLALGLAFKDIAANFFAGIYLAIKSPINEGDLIEYDENYGNVKKIGMRATTIQTLQGQDVIIPNRFIMENAFTHYTVNKIRRIDLTVGISYGDDLEKAEKITKEAISKIEYLLPDKPIDFYYQEFGSSSINFVIRYWIRFGKETDYLQALSDGIKNIKKLYDANDITITFPIRTLDFGIKGGETLREMLVKTKKEIENGKEYKED